MSSGGEDSRRCDGIVSRYELLSILLVFGNPEMDVVC